MKRVIVDWVRNKTARNGTTYEHDVKELSIELVVLVSERVPLDGVHLLLVDTALLNLETSERSQPAFRGR